MVEPRASRSAASIHMFFMRFSIAVIWLDEAMCVVDKKLALPWRPFYAPSMPARYVLEAGTEVFHQVEVGEVLHLEPYRA